MTSEYFDRKENDLVERSMKAYIANHYYERMREERDRAREMAARFEEELEQLKNGGDDE
mgnify:CR=1 FL=1